ncbi:fumarylacetoacetate (FAA) hydrolase family protein [Mycobacterium xenopi 3993]|nr:fumarylacetoacetate (FAA) hydrolase family protein [Mycobacterium xenopi 3993]
MAAAVLNHPGNGVAWLANRVAPYGVSLQRGEVILSGSFTKPVFAEPGDTFVADYGALGTVSVVFDREETVR